MKLAETQTRTPREQTLFAGRPTFGACRQGEGKETKLTLFEFLPDEQARARRRRAERAGRSVVLSDPTEVFSQSMLSGPWEWNGWQAVKVERITDNRIQAILPVIRQSLQEADLDPEPLTSTQGGEVLIPEEQGLRLALACLGVKPLRRYDRMRALARGIARMSTEECYYWHALCRSPSSPNGVKALRTLLTDHLD